MENILKPLLGGVLIAISASSMLGGLGRITGISGIIGAILSRPTAEHFWRYAFLLGLITGGVVLNFVRPQFFHYEISGSNLKIVMAGLLVGFGTRLGGGCTSGHGVCGMARLAKRSFVATLLFISFGMLTVALQRAFLW